MAKITRFCSTYTISEDGQITNIKTGKQLKPFSDGKRGYMKVRLYINKKPITEFVHRLVALKYVDGDITLTVNHIDSDKLNNNVSNLEWVSNADNLKHSFLSGARDITNMGNKKGKSFAFDHELRAVMFSEVIQGNSIRSVAIKYGVCVKTLQYQYKQNRSAA